MMKGLADVGRMTSGAMIMSEFEEASGRTNRTGLWIGVISVVVVGGGLLICAGVVGVGLLAPVVFKQRQVQREAVERQAAANAVQRAAAEAAAKARAAQPSASEADDRQPKEESAEPTTDDVPPYDESHIEKEGSRNSSP
jgi:hypothetical protein